MSVLNTIQTILIIGATSGIGEQFARRLHAIGKKVIITGRRADRLASIQSELGSNVSTYQWDITDLPNLSSQASEILTQHPETNSVFVVSGLGNVLNFLDASTSSDAKLIAECTTNVTAPVLLTRAFMPHLSALAAKGQKSSFLLMGSGIGFAPNPFFPVYGSTKAAIHALAVALRQSVNKAEEKIKTNLSIVEVAPPYVATDFDKGFRNPKGPQPMPLEEFMDETMKGLSELGEDGKTIREVAVGSAGPRVDLWRGSLGKYLKEAGMEG